MLIISYHGLTAGNVACSVCPSGAYNQDSGQFLAQALAYIPLAGESGYLVMVSILFEYVRNSGFLLTSSNAFRDD